MNSPLDEYISDFNLVKSGYALLNPAAEHPGESRDQPLSLFIYILSMCPVRPDLSILGLIYLAPSALSRQSANEIKPLISLYVIKGRF